MLWKKYSINKAKQYGLIFNRKEPTYEISRLLCGRQIKKTYPQRNTKLTTFDKKAEKYIITYFMKVVKKWSYWLLKQPEKYIIAYFMKVKT